jgi:hypothetical protein
MDQPLYEELKKITEKTIEEDIRTELIDAMYTTGFALSGEEEKDGVRVMEFKREDVIVKMEVQSGMEKETESEATPPEDK